MQQQKHQNKNNPKNGIKLCNIGESGFKSKKWFEFIDLPSRYQSRYF